MINKNVHHFKEEAKLNYPSTELQLSVTLHNWISDIFKQKIFLNNAFNVSLRKLETISFQIKFRQGNLL